MSDTSGGKGSGRATGAGDGASPDDARPRIDRSDEEPIQRGATRILLVEDNPTHRLLAAGLLRGRGHRVTFATNGIEAVELMRDGAFDLVLMDVQMPRMDGIEAVRVIRALEEERGSERVPIVALTSLTSDEDRRRVREAGMDDHLAKPIDPGRLEDAIARHVPSSGADFVLERALSKVAGDHGHLSTIVEAFLQETPWRLDALQRAIERRDETALAETAHRIEGAARQLEMPRLRDVAHRIALRSEEGDFAAAAALTHELEAAFAGSSDAARRALAAGA